MRTSKATSYMLAASVGIAMFAGCSGGSPQMAPNPVGVAPGASPVGLGKAAHNVGMGDGVPPAGFFRPDAQATPLIFVTDERKNIVNIYLQAGKNKKVAQITGLHRPLGLTTDRAGNAYVPNREHIRIYPPPYTMDRRSHLGDPGEFPYNVAVSRVGVVGVVNICKAPSCPLGSPSVTFYAKNSTKPCVTLDASADFALLDFAAFDHQGNLYISGRHANNYDAIGEVSGGCKATTITPLSTTNLLLGPASIKVDNAGRIAILNEPAYGRYFIDTYNPPVSGSLGTPVSATPLLGLKGPTDFAFLASGTDLYVANFVGATVNEYAYPAGGAAENVIQDHNGLPSDVAVTPPLIP